MPHPRLLFRSAPALDLDNPNQSGDAFPSGAQWSPDASCIATAQDGCVLLYDTPAAALGGGGAAIGSFLRPSLALGDPGSGEPLYSFAFFPGFDARAAAAAELDADPTTTTTAPCHPCCLATSARGQPVRLWDCLTGAVRAAYGASSAAAPEGGGASDALATPLAVAFSADGAALAAGYPRGDLVLFDVSRPGRDAEAAAVCCRPLKKKRRSKGEKQQQQQQQQQQGAARRNDNDNRSPSSYAPDIRLPGPIGCVAFAPVGFFGGGGGYAHVLAAGSYGGAVGVFDVRVAARRPQPAASGAVDAAAAAATTDLASLLPTEFGRRSPPPRITADASATLGPAVSLAPVLAIDCCSGGNGGNGQGGGGVTQLHFAPPASPQPLLFCGYRGAHLFSDRIDGWDVRALREPVVSLQTGPSLSLRRRGGGGDDAPAPNRRRPRYPSTTPVPGRHQRIQFDVEPTGGRFLVTGSADPVDGAVCVWGLRAGNGGGGGGGSTTAQPPPLLASMRVARDAAANAVAVCPGDPSLVAVASGQRGYPLAPLSGSASASNDGDGDSGGEEEEEGEGEGEEDKGLPGAALALWRWGGPGDVGGEEEQPRM